MFLCAAAIQKPTFGMLMLEILGILIGLPFRLTFWIGIPVLFYGSIASVIFIPASRPWILIPTAVIALLCYLRIRHLNR